MSTGSLMSLIPPSSECSPDALYEIFVDWAASEGFTLYPHQDEAVIGALAGDNLIVSTPTGSGKSMIAIGAHFAAVAAGGKTYYTAPIKALVNEKFFDLCRVFGAQNVGIVTGDASVNPDADIVCCTAEILANIALREGNNADVAQVVMDEFHFLADPHRGWAWQTCLAELPQAQFVIMSATLGDVTDLSAWLSEATGKQTLVISGGERPVPLVYNWSSEALPDTIDKLIEGNQWPIYMVHSTQLDAADHGANLAKELTISSERKKAIRQQLAGFKFAPGFGRILQNLLLAGVGVHHAGMLPRYRRLVESLAQQGLLTVICGTDTLGVGINVPIRTVLFTALTKFDGNRSRVLRSREFHQIAGRAGRAGFDSIGYVVAQAPEHQVENAKLVAKAGDDPKKLKKLKRKKPPEGFINYTEETFQKLIDSVPEKLYARIRVTHSMLLNLLNRDQDTAAALNHLIDSAIFDPVVKRKLVLRAVRLGKSLLEAGVVERLATPTAGGRRYQLNLDLQSDFALNQPLSAFALEAIAGLDRESENFTLDLVSVIESTLEDPMPVLRSQRGKAKGELVQRLKDEGMEYEERIVLLDEVTWPMPLAEHLNETYTALQKTHPWLVETPVSAKSVVREMYEKAMTFSEYVSYHKIQRSEGVLLRYLMDAARALRQTVPETERTEQFTDLLSWLTGIIQMTDSSLANEWEELVGQVSPVAGSDQPGEVDLPQSLTSNIRGFKVMVRNAMFRRVELCAADDVDQLAGLNSFAKTAQAGSDDEAEQTAGSRYATTMTADDWYDDLGDYWDVYEDIDTGPDARSPKLLDIYQHHDKFGNEVWALRQIICDPEGNHDWSLEAIIDLAECDAADELIIHDLGLTDSPTPLKELVADE